MSAAWDYQTGHVGKSWFPNKQRARDGLRSHNRELCPKCRRGTFYWQAYPCDFGGVKHWHRGHKPVNGWKAQQGRVAS